MRHFDEIYEIAAKRKGGGAALEALIDKPRSAAELAAIPEDRWLAEISKYVFRTGLAWQVIDSKWDGFEAAFYGFDIGRCAMMDDEMFDRLITDTRIVRSGPKIASVRDNAAFFLELRTEGGVGKVLGEWPDEDFVGLLEMLKKRGARLGGQTGAYGMRMLGRSSFILSPDVVARLVAEGVVDKAPSSKAGLRAVQDAFNIWRAQSGRSLTEISRVLAMSV
ncbi:DNA-3-methyladenine glycosylase I [Lentibacter sp. XHP0401]|uniref:DNA-3-methyladenine glycosylase I n=1 Tax=Lentibacter sp. XHP0401 TaxID=2984334 RepID=UPI0021E78B9B|nr:DNA-3-methyladenine glycosylase I [Lentibacter sp. XHP0401]MCV2893307.1 DNA-3-methyladenine glycosylase I [Lentibacter sp. XHP0401]